MHARLLRILLPLAVAALLTVGSAAGAGTLPSWMLREGSVYHAAALADGSEVFLDAVVGGKIEPAYFTVHDPFSRNDPAGNLVVLTSPPVGLSVGQTIDIHGTMTTLPSGYRAVTDVTVWAYTDEAGAVLTRGPLIKGLLEPAPWQWMADITARERGAVREPLSASGEPNPMPRPAPVLYAHISDAVAALRAEGKPEALAVFVCKPVVSTGPGFFVMGEDLRPDTLKVYCATDVTAGDRIRMVSGQLWEVDGTAVLCAGSGPDGVSRSIMQLSDPPGPGDSPTFGGVVLAAVQGTVAYALTLADSATATLTGKVVTAD